MALMVPESIPSKASQGETTLYKVLSEKLSDDFYVWYEPSVQGRLSYFTILAANFGLLVIKVANWFPNQIVSANNDNFTIQSPLSETERMYVQQQERRIRQRSMAGKRIQPSPMQQKKRYLDKLLNKLRTYQILTHPDGELVFPIGVSAGMSNITIEQARERNIYELLGEQKMVYREELMSWNNLCEAELVNRLKRMFTDKLPARTLTDDQIQTIKGIIYPEIAIKDLPASPSSVPDGVVLEDNTYVISTLDHRQECIARAIGEGHRIIYGVAGSGKTLILLCRAKFLLNQNTNRRILILCYNISLASHLKSILHEDPRNPHFKKIDVMHFDAWVENTIGRQEYRKLRHLVNYGEYVVEKALNQLNTLPQARKYDAILVDEAQAFYPYWFKCCVAALKEPENGNLMIVSDGKQSFYKRPGFTWKSVGVKAVGRTTSRKFQLDINYRNTREILAAAWSLVKNIQDIDEAINIENTDDSEVTFPIIEPRAAVRQGYRPVLHIVQTEQQEIESAIREIQKIQQEFGCELREIAVLYKWDAILPKERQLLYYLTKRLKSLGLDTYWVTETSNSERKYSINIPGIRIMTTHKSLGLEFKAVLILGVQEFYSTRSPEALVALHRKKLYVAMTRAQDVLHVFGSGNSRLIEELQQSGNFEIQYE